MFDTGLVLVTEGCRKIISSKAIARCIKKHSKGDFGKASEDTQFNNLENINNKGMILSVYNIKNKTLLIQTAKGHKRTTVMLASEF